MGKTSSGSGVAVFFFGKDMQNLCAQVHIYSFSFRSSSESPSSLQEVIIKIIRASFNPQKNLILIQVFSRKLVVTCWLNN